MSAARRWSSVAGSDMGLAAAPSTFRALVCQRLTTDLSGLVLEERLLPLNFRLIFLTRSPESFAQAREERLKVSGNPRQYDDLEVFKREQELLESLVSRSQLPCLRVDISDNHLDAAVERVVDWMETTGGLSMPD